MILYILQVVEGKLIEEGMKAHRKDNKHKIRPIMRKDAIYMIRWSMENCFTCKCLTNTEKKKQLSHRICVSILQGSEVWNQPPDCKTLNWFLLNLKYADWMIKRPVMSSFHCNEILVTCQCCSWGTLGGEEWGDADVCKVVHQSQGRGGEELGVGAVKLGRRDALSL